MRNSTFVPLCEGSEWAIQASDNFVDPASSEGFVWGVTFFTLFLVIGAAYAGYEVDWLPSDRDSSWDLIRLLHLPRHCQGLVLMIFSR